MGDSCRSQVAAFEELEPRLALSAGASISAATTQVLFNQQIGLTTRAQYVTLTNTSRSPLTINSITVTGTDATRFSINTRYVPNVIPRGGSAAVKVTFSPLTTSVAGAALQVASNARNAPTLSVALRGLGTAGLYDQFEPSLQQIMDTAQIPISVGDRYPLTPLLDGRGRSNEVSMPLLRAAGAGPVRISLLSVFSYATNPTVTVGWYESGTQALHPQLVAPVGNAQTFMPTVTGSARFYPTGTFGLYGLWPDQSHAPSYSDDTLNTWDTVNPHKLRFYPYKLPNGQTVPNAYVVAMEESNTAGSWDYNDAVAIVTNVVPASATASGVARPAAATAMPATATFATTAITKHVWDE